MPDSNIMGNKYRKQTDTDRIVTNHHYAASHVPAVN